MFAMVPTVETVGYFRSSLRDSEPGQSKATLLTRLGRAKKYPAGAIVIEIVRHIWHVAGVGYGIFRHQVVRRAL